MSVALMPFPREFTLILDEDPDLARALSEADRQAATRAFRAAVITADPPRWQPPECDPDKTFGLLVLDGLIGRRITVATGVFTELITCGDIIRPWDQQAPWHDIPPAVEWRIYARARLALLDERLTMLIGRRPELLLSFSGRLLQRVQSISYLTAVSHLLLVEDRLLAALWHLAAQCGRVTPHGVRVPLRLTHETLGEIVGAGRPTVTLAVRKLEQRGQLVRVRGGHYVLTGDPRMWRSRHKSGLTRLVPTSLADAEAGPESDEKCTVG